MRSRRFTRSCSKQLAQIGRRSVTSRSFRFECKRLMTITKQHPNTDVKRMALIGGRMLALRHDADNSDAHIANLRDKVNWQIEHAQDFKAIVAALTLRSPPVRLDP